MSNSRIKQIIGGSILLAFLILLGSRLLEQISGMEDAGLLLFLSVIILIIVIWAVRKILVH